jgi:N-acetyl-gamma-glutamyl-phosphate reductase
MRTRVHRRRRRHHRARDRRPARRAQRVRAGHARRARRKDPAARREALNEADFAILCLPDDAAREAVGADRPGSAVRVIDASTAHRVTPGGSTAFPKWSATTQVARARRVSNPGCYSTGFIALVAPLVRAGLLPADWPYTCNAVSGYSGGGKALIARFEDDRDIAWRGYALGLGHKHVPEMQERCGLALPPLFSPAVIPAHRGMVTESAAAAGGDARRRHARGDARVAGRVLRRQPGGADGRRARPESCICAGRGASGVMEPPRVRIANGSQARLVACSTTSARARSGAAVQSLNLWRGFYR